MSTGRRVDAEIERKKRELEHIRMFNGTAKLRDKVIQRSYPPLTLKRMRKVNDLIGHALLLLTVPGDRPE